MAEDCITVTFEDGNSWDYCWDDGIAEPNWDAENVISGLRKSRTPIARSWRICQYFIKGMSAICINWSSTGCGAGTGSETPTGYNNGSCDYLGRRHWCSHYSAPADDLGEYICVAPNMFLTGLKDQYNNPIPKDDIGGYNNYEGDTAPGKCDCYGMGRGLPGCNKVGDLDEEAGSDKIEEELSKLPVVCEYYRPYQMSFGSHDEVFGDERLPLNYVIYNYMACFQKCQWWDRDCGSFFNMSSGQVVLEDDEGFDETGRIQYCICEDGLANDYNTRTAETESEDEHYMAHGGFLLENVWAKAGGHICNGARMECPCYTGKWNFLTEEKMLPGMPVTANQIFELRFWSYDWKSQEEYDAYFMQRPNTSTDPETASIFTFKKWDSLGTRPSDSIMVGKELSMCQPAPLNAKEFLPDKYIEVTSPVKYTPMGVEVGTSGGTSHIFSSLVRSPVLPTTEQFVVVYPYRSDSGVWSAEVCIDHSDDTHGKYHHTMGDDSISTVGFTTRNKNVFCVNLTHSTVVPGHLVFSSVVSTFTEHIILLPPQEKLILFDAIRLLITDSMAEDPEWISCTTSDSQQGYFVIPPLKLKYGSNRLFVCVDFEDGTWEFRKINVKNAWSGGVIQQTSYTHRYEDGAYNSQPLKISPPAKAEVRATPLGVSSRAELHAVYSEVQPDGGKAYSYRIIEHEEKNVEVEKWCCVGNSSAVFAEIDNVNLNYIFNWKIVSAEMVPKEETDSEGNSKTIRKNASIVKMEVIDIDQNSVIPNVCILIPVNPEEDRVSFMNSEWGLKIDFTYEKFDPSGKASGKIIAGAGKNSSYKAPPVSIKVEAYSATIEDIEEGPIGIIAFFTNEGDRILSVMATRVYVMIADVRCRGVDIYYKYFAEGSEHVLIPESGFCIEVSGAEQNGKTNGYAYHPTCGDHELGSKWEGPMWYPFNACKGFDLYDEFTICNYCTASFVGPDDGAITYTDDFSYLVGIGQVVHRKDFRYCGPAEYYARGEVRGASACHCGCQFYWSGPIIGFDWTGIGKIKTRIGRLGVLDPTALGAPAPFGNDGCELTEKYLSRDYVTHYDSYGVVRAEWMPVVMDNSSFYFSFNAFDGGNEREEHSYCDASTTNPFRYVDQLSLFTLDNISEKIQMFDESGLPINDRRSFDEMFKIHYEGNCSYPPLVLEPNRVMFYDFKDKNVAWAWQERWLDIERIIPSESEELNGEDEKDFRKLEFILKYDKPKYVYSLYKEEHRLICSEKIHIITYKGPKVEEGKLIRYPTIKLGGGEPRPFEIIYDVYDDTQVTWTKSDEVDGSSDGIYEKTTGDEWIHIENHDTLFDDDASASKEDDRCVVIGIDFSGDEIKRYYNRGVDVKIPRSRLTYLPMDVQDESFKEVTGEYGTTVYNLYVEVDVTPEIDDRVKPVYEIDFKLTKIFMWDEALVSIISKIDEHADKKFAITGISISGFWGYDNIQHLERKYIKPGIKLEGVKASDSTATLCVDSGYEAPYFKRGLGSYNIDISVSVTPKDMIDDILQGFNLSLIGEQGCIIAVSSLVLTIATEYLDDEITEEIDVWERKYLPSTFSNGNEELNLDGPGDNMSYNLDMNLSGVYFPFANILDEVAAQDKMRSAYSNGRKREDEELSISISNLHDVEAEKQKELYEEAYDLDPDDDTLTFSSVIPPILSEHVRSKYEVMGKCKFTFGRIEWDNHYLVAQFEQFDFWQPGGHFYTWSSDVTIEKCMFFGMFGMEVHSGFFNHYKHTGECCPKAADLFNAYYTVRPTAAVAKYNRWIILMGEPPAAGGDLLSQANPYAIGIPPGGAWT